MPERFMMLNENDRFGYDDINAVIEASKKDVSQRRKSVTVYKMVPYCVVSLPDPVVTMCEATAAPQPADAPYRVGEPCEVRFFRRDGWLPGVIRKIGGAGNPWVEYREGGETNTGWFDIRDCRRPRATVAAPKFERGDYVECGTDRDGKDHDACSGLILDESGGDVLVWSYGDGDAHWFSRGYVKKV